MKRRFRACIYVDVWVPESDNVIEDKSIATIFVERIAQRILNAFVGEVELYEPGKGLIK